MFPLEKLTLVTKSGHPPSKVCRLYGGFFSLNKVDGQALEVRRQPLEVRYQIKHAQTRVVVIS
jgi:hypothetical protein